MTTQHGYLVLADIAGYTSYLAGVELDHAHDILSDLLEVIVVQFRVALTLAKLEGDAVFAYTPQSAVPRGETLLELVEATYTAFRDRRDGIQRRTTCECRACSAIPTLDLKFFVHAGDYVVQSIAGTQELVGSDVNLVHRLMKNHVTEATGWTAYALFTAAALARLGLPPEGLHAQTETYDHLDPVAIYSLDLRARYEALVAARREYITPAQADLVIVQDLPAPVTVVWDWINDPARRARWDELDAVVPVLRPGGRTTAGARNHCMHGREAAIEDILDWRPFEYFTVRILKRGVYVSRTCAFEALPDGRTRLSTNFVVQLPLPAWLTRRVAKQFLTLVGIPRTRAAMARLMDEEYAASQGTP